MLAERQWSVARNECLLFIEYLFKEVRITCKRKQGFFYKSQLNITGMKYLRGMCSKTRKLRSGFNVLNEYTGNTKWLIERQ